MTERFIEPVKLAARVNTQIPENFDVKPLFKHHEREWTLMMRKKKLLGLWLAPVTVTALAIQETKQKGIPNEPD